MFFRNKLSPSIDCQVMNHDSACTYRLVVLQAKINWVKLGEEIRKNDTLVMIGEGKPTLHAPNLFYKDHLFITSSFL